MGNVQPNRLEVTWMLTDSKWHREQYDAPQAKRLVDGILDNLAPGESVTITPVISDRS